MDKSVFAERLRRAAEHTRDFTRTLILEPLPDSIRFDVLLNQSFDGNPLHADERVYPDDPRRIPEHRRSLLSEEQAVELLWREGTVPEWIDLAIKQEGGEHTRIEMLCCGRFTANEQLLYHEQEGYPPFHVRSPPMPLSQGPEPRERFSLYWYGKPANRRELAGLRERAEGVELLSLSGKGFDDESLEVLAGAPLRRLRHLQLERTRIRGPGLRHLGRNVPLKSLTFWHSVHRLPLDLEPLGAFSLLEELSIWSWATPHGLSTLSSLRRLRELTLQVRSLGDEELRALSGLTRLRALTLSDTSVRDGGLVHLQPLRKLRHLSLEGTRVGDRGLLHLPRPSLRTVSLRGTRVTAQGVAWLQEKCPRLRIHSGPRESTHPVKRILRELARRVGSLFKRG